MAEPLGPTPDYPVAELPALALAGPRQVTRYFGRVMLLLLLGAPIALALAPWQQNLRGEGRIIEFDPVNRPMPLQARTDGIVSAWHVREGAHVTTGTPIVDLADNDPNVLERLQAQLDAARNKRAAALRKRDELDGQVRSAELARTAALRLAEDEIAAAQQALAVARQGVEVAKQRLALAKTAEQMWQGLVADRLGAGFELQRATQERSIAVADLAAKQAGVAGAEANLRAKHSARERTAQVEAVKLQEARVKRAAADADIAEAEGSIPKLERDLERQRRQRIVAPVDGYVQNLVANGRGGNFVKQGTTLAVLVPATKQPAVELLVDGNDVTLIEVGRHVRLQFEGWPAVQFVGWPSAAVGTFGGRVAFVDRFGTSRGKFRVMVIPDERPFHDGDEGPAVRWLRGLLTSSKPRARENPHRWPGDAWLRQGTRAKGWILLDRVSLGFEVWRQLNGFPPTIERPANDKGLKR
ncbi:MAG: HlyD family efflux transporter periplasmic adaptor subunit [Planctomycetes bacterium]|nr:HlyD family efflux transporter periplasmic adaptor subunit [Planctomycetota bacterium]